jgi:hypothetical protein
MIVHDRVRQMLPEAHRANVILRVRIVHCTLVVIAVRFQSKDAPYFLLPRGPKLSEVLTISR